MDIFDHNKYKSWGRSGIFVAAALAVWYAAAASGRISPLILASPVGVGRAIVQMLWSNTIGKDLAATAARVVITIGIAIGIGIPMGLVLGYWRNLYSYIEKPLDAVRSVPATALFPLLLVIAGVGEASIVALAAFPSVLVIIVNTAAGVGFANHNRIHHASVLQLSAYAMVCDVLFYEALPSIFQGIRTAVSFILVLVVAVEMFIGVSGTGLGRTIYDYQITYRIPETYAAIVVTGAFGVLLNAAVTAVEKRMLHWLPARVSLAQNSAVNRF
jgi:ABC-type nitrate/sulfonate/bicarbonate transport system permease component